MTIGDSSTYSYFKNIIGFINDGTISRFTNWTSDYYSEQYLTTILIDGVGSTFFNIDSSTNTVTYLIIENLDFRNIYGSHDAASGSI